MAHSAYGSMADNDFTATSFKQGMSLAEVVPAALANQLQLSGTDITQAGAVLLKNRDAALFLFDSAAADKTIVLLKNYKGGGILLQLDKDLSAGRNGTAITFDSSKNAFSTQQLSPECVQHLISIIQSFFLAIYECLFSFSAPTCIGGCDRLFYKHRYDTRRVRPKIYFRYYC
jgi:hypothetical protein